VYGTKTGTKYHRAGCRHLARRQVALTLKAAAAKYQPCSFCEPPAWSSVADVVASSVAAAPLVERATAVPPRPTSVVRAVSGGRWQATTKRGAQCSRKAQADRSYCWQH
jgi:hypothetical protein